MILPHRSNREKWRPILHCRRDHHLRPGSVKSVTGHHHHLSRISDLDVDEPLRGDYLHTTPQIRL